MIRDVGRASGVTVIDLYTPLSNRKELFPDAVHPNAAGARLMAAAIYPVLTDHAPPLGKSE